MRATPPPFGPTTEDDRRLQSVIDALPAPISYLDTSLTYRFVNQAYVACIGKAFEEIVGKSMRDVLGEQAFKLAEAHLQLVHSGSATAHEIALPGAAANPRQAEASYRADFAADATLRGIFMILREASTGACGEESLKHSEKRFLAFMDNLPGAAWLKDTDGRYVYANCEAERVFGKSLPELRGKTDDELFPPETARQFRQNDDAVLRAGDGIQTMEVLRQPDGIDHHSVVSKFIVPGPAENIRYVGGVAVDITGRLMAENALRESERRYRFLAESIPQIVFTARPDGVVSYHNERLLQFLGATREQMVKLGWIHFRHPDDRAAATRSWNDAVQSGQPYECMYRMLRGSDQTWRWHLARAMPMRNDAGQVVMWFGTCTDIDDQKRIADALRESEERLRLAAGAAQFGAYDSDLVSGEGYWSAELKVIFGLNADDPVSVRSGEVPEFVHPEDRAAVEHAMRESFRPAGSGQFDHEHRIIRPDGSLRWLQVKGRTIFERDQNGTARATRAIGVMIDITARRQDQQALRESEASLARAQRIARLGSWEFDWRTQQLDWSEQMYRLFNLEPQQFVPTPQSVLRFVPVREQQAIIDTLRKAMQERSNCHFDHRIILDNGEMRHLSQQAEIIFGSDGSPLRFVGTTLDITEQKKIEQELEAANRAKDQFLATLSHELRTPLTPVVLAIDAMRQDPAFPVRLQDDLDMIWRNVGLEAKLIDDLLDLTRVARGKLELRLELLDAHAALEDAIRSCCAPELAEKRIALDVQLRAKRHHIRADAARLQQVFFNILRNAAKFTPPGGSISVRSENLSNERIAVHVSDSGVGIEPQVLPRLFHAFEQGDRTVTRQFGGLGLGLTICKAIIEMHGGSIRAHSDGLNRGSTFSVELPLATLPAKSGHATAPRKNRPAAPAQQPLKILVVEDHEPTAGLMQRLLAQLSHEVKVANDLESARRVASEHALDLLISDLGLPDGSGLDLMRDLRQKFAIKGIALSGYGMEEDRIQSKAAGFAEHLVKPISFDALEAAIARVVGNPTASRTSEINVSPSIR